MKNKTFAIEAAPSAIPPNPNMAATMAIIKKITDQRNITNYLCERITQHFCKPVRHILYHLNHSNLRTMYQAGDSRRKCRGLST